MPSRRIPTGLPPPSTAKLFMNGRSQAVRLPMEFRFDAQEVHIRRDEATGDVILSAAPASTVRDFIELRNRLGADDTPLVDRTDAAHGARDPFDDWRE